MIDVPARVKDALRSGDYRKNYRITVEGYGILSEHKYESPEITIYYEEGPMSEYWTSTAITIEVPEESKKVEITIDGIVGVVFWDNNYVSVANPNYEEWFDIDQTNKITKITVPENQTFQILGEHTIQYIESVNEFTYINVRCQKDNVLQNDRIVSESVKIDEHMCSSSDLKFGLCEGSSIEFQYFDLDGAMIRDYRIFVEVEIEYKNESNRIVWYRIPMGWFTVDSCSRQASTGIVKATAYNKLKSDYLDQDCTARVTEIIQSKPLGRASVSDIISALLNDYTIEKATYVEKEGYIYNRTTHYTTDSGIRIYTVDGFPYNPPAVPVVNEDVIGKYFGIYTVDFYYIPSGEASAQTSDIYYYDFDFDALWNVIGSTRYSTAWQHVTGSDLFEVSITPYAVDDTEGYFQISDSIYAGNISIQNGQSTIYLRDHQSGHVQTPLFTGYYPKITIAVLVECDFQNGTETSPFGYTITNKISAEAQQLINDLSTADWVTIYKYYGSDIDSTNISVNDIKQGITLRDLQSASFEINCQYGKLDRVTDLFSGIELNNGALYPRDNLYPDNGLYPMGTSESGFPSMYSKLWADEGNVRSFRYLIITYKTTETISGQTQEVEKTLQRTVNANGTDDYNMSDNWLFKNLVWTTSDVGDYADAMVTKMQGIRWFPFEMWCAGLPFLEAGDEIEIQMKEGTYKSYVLRRTLSGIQNLQDEMINGTLDIF